MYRWDWSPSYKGKVDRLWPIWVALYQYKYIYFDRNCEQCWSYWELSSSLEDWKRYYLIRILNLDKKPETLVFHSYTAEDLRCIIEQRIHLCNQSLHTEFPLFHSAAIELCSKKVVIIYFCLDPGWNWWCSQITWNLKEIP